MGQLVVHSNLIENHGDRDLEPGALFEVLFCLIEPMDVLAARFDMKFASSPNLTLN